MDHIKGQVADVEVDDTDKYPFFHHVIRFVLLPVLCRNVLVSSQIARLYYSNNN
jgi:hypothetical protein